MPRKRTLGGFFKRSAQLWRHPGSVLGVVLLTVLLSAVQAAHADFVISTTPGDGETLDFGYTLIGNPSSQSITATATGDSGGQGYFGGATDLGGNPSSVFGPITSSLFTLDNAGDSTSRTYTYSPTVRGTDQGQVQITYLDSSVAATINLTGQGVAPVNQIDSNNTDASLTRIGTSNLLSITITNTGDGNLSGLGDQSNLLGGVRPISSSVFVGSGGVLSVPGSGDVSFSYSGEGYKFSLSDSASITFYYLYGPTDHKLDSLPVWFDFSNGSDDGTNGSQSVSVSLTGQGVGPIYQSTDPSSDPEKVIRPGVDPDAPQFDFGDVVAGDSSTLPLRIRNITTDPNSITGDPADADDTLTDLTLQRVTFTKDPNRGPDEGNDDPMLFSVSVFQNGDWVAYDDNFISDNGPLVVHKGDFVDFQVNFSTTEDTEPGLKTAVMTFLTDQDAPFGQEGKSFSYLVKGVVTPEPGSLTLLSIGALGLAGYGWRRRRQMTV